MEFSNEEIDRLAKLSRLKLSDDEVQDMRTQLGKIVDYVTVLKNAPVDNVEPFIYPTELSNVMREDVRKDSLTVEEALQNAPNKDTQYFLVPKVIE